MKVTISRPLLVAGIVLVAGSSLLLLVRPVKVTFFQDANSHAVRAVRHRWFIKVGDELLFRTSRSDPQNANWKLGVEEAFRRPLQIGEALYLSKNGASGVIRTDSMSGEKLSYSFRSLHTNAWTVAISTNSHLFALGEHVRWSQKDLNAIYIYADPYWRMPKDVLLKIYFPVPSIITSTPPVLVTLPWELPTNGGK